MTSLKIHDAQGKQVGTYEFDLAELAPSINKQLLHDVVVMYEANQRQGTHRTKNRNEVAYSTKKLYRQKGTGNARAGARTSGIRRGGADIHPIRPRDYSYRLPRKAVRLATRMALVSKIEAGSLTLIDKLSFAAPKTSEMAGILKAVGLGGKQAPKRLLVVPASYDVNVYKSTRNIDGVSILPSAELNARELLVAHRILMTTDALDSIRETAKKQTAKPEAV